MKREKFEVRGALVATIESRFEAPFDENGAKELFAVISETETRFFDSAKAYVKSRTDAVSAMSASERRKLKCEKILLVISVIPNGELIKVNFAASISCGRDVSLREYGFLWDNERKLIVDGKKYRKKQASEDVS